MKINIINRINSDVYRAAISAVYTPNKRPITKEIVLPEGAALTSADTFYRNNGEILKNATINIKP